MGDKTNADGLALDRGDVTIYVAASCPECNMTRVLLDGANVKYQRLHASEHLKHIEGMGHRKLPVVEVKTPKGVVSWCGFRHDLLKALLNGTLGEKIK